jgi:poly(ADP-ribose) glycohydrolase
MDTRLPILTGNWGCGAFGGDPQLKSLIQWIAVSLCGERMVYFTYGENSLKNLDKVVAMFKRYTPK